MTVHTTINPGASNFPLVFIPRLKELSKFVKSNGNDEITAVQAAADWCETNKYTLYWDVPVTIQGTLYLGNISIQHSGRTDAILTVLSDSNWNQLGTANRRTEGGIITKASTAAGYGVTESNIIMEGMLIDFTNTADAEAIKSCFVPEYWKKGRMVDTKIQAVSCTAALETTVFDMYKGCQDVSLINPRLYNTDVLTTVLRGGAWIRSFDASVPTKNIDVINMDVTCATPDEAFAVFNNVTLGDGAMENINIRGGNIYHSGTTAGAGGATAGGLWIRNDTARSQETAFCSVQGLSIEIEELKTGGAGLNLDDMSGGFSDITIKINDVASGATSVSGVKCNTFDGTRAKPELNRVKVISDGAPTADVLTAYTGYLNLNECYSDSINSGNFNIILKSLSGVVRGGEFNGTDNLAADIVTKIDGAILHGPATDCYNAQETTFEINTNTFTSATVIQNDGNAVDYTRFHDIVVNLSGTGALSKPFFVNVDTELDIDGFTVIGDGTTMASIAKDNIIGGSVTQFRKVRNIVYDNGTTKDKLYPESRYIKTNSPNLTPGTMNVINIDTAARLLTLTDFANHQGRFMLYNNKASGANNFRLTLSAGTFDGTNTVATSTAVGDYLIVDVPPDGNGTVVKNSGFTLS